MKNSRLESRRKKIPLEEKILFEKNFAIVEQIAFILAKKGKDQKYLADRLNKNESEISKWMRGNHNFTMKTIAKIEAVLGEDILICPKDAKQTEYHFYFKLSADNIVKVQSEPALKKKAISMSTQNVSMEVSAEATDLNQLYLQQIN